MTVKDIQKFIDRLRIRQNAAAPAIIGKGPVIDAIHIEARNSTIKELMDVRQYINSLHKDCPPEEYLLRVNAYIYQKQIFLEDQ